MRRSCRLQSLIITARGTGFHPRSPQPPEMWPSVFQWPPTCIQAVDVPYRKLKRGVFCCKTCKLKNSGILKPCGFLPVPLKHNCLRFNCFLPSWIVVALSQLMNWWLEISQLTLRLPLGSCCLTW